MNFRLSSDIIIWFLDPDFLIGHAISATRGRFLLIFALDKLNVRHISTSAPNWPTDLESVSRDAHLAMIVSTNFEVNTTSHHLVIALLLLIRYVTLWPWPLTFWLWSVVIHGGSRVNPYTKFDDPTAICSWVTSSDISHRIPLTGEGRSLGGKVSGGRGRPPANILIPLERQLNALQNSWYNDLKVRKKSAELVEL